MRVAIRLTPRARAARLDGIAGDRLRVAVTAPPAENQANEALLRRLAREWRFAAAQPCHRRRREKPRQGGHIAGTPQQLMARLALLIGEF